MSELIRNAQERKELLKHMILQLHKGEAPEEVKKQLVRLLGQIPYGDVVDVEQELISEGLSQKEVFKLCDVHTDALRGTLDQAGAKIAPPGHPVHTFIQENRALTWEIASLEKLYSEVGKLKDQESTGEILIKMKAHFNALMDVEKHYQRKENLLFPFLEKHGITGPPKVMWGKHDEARDVLKKALGTLKDAQEDDVDWIQDIVVSNLKPASQAIEEMIYKEEEILFPMSLDKLSDAEWYEIDRQSPEIGYCLYDPVDTWQPEGIVLEKENSQGGEKIQLPSGSFTLAELTSMLNTIPFDLTFVDRDDTVRYFTQGRDRIFARTRAILGRNVQLCHPPSSVHIVEQILDDFRSGRQDRAPFWIELQGRFIHIEYFALRGENGAYLGTLEVSQDLTEKRELEDEQRLLSYGVEGE